MNIFEADDVIERITGSVLNDPPSLDEKSRTLFIELFSVLDRFKPSGGNNLRDLWFSVPVDDRKLFDEGFSDGGYSKEDIDSFWNEKYLEPVRWYHIESVHNTLNDGREFCGLFINSSYALAINDDNVHGYPWNLSEFILWLTDNVNKLFNEVSAFYLKNPSSEYVPDIPNARKFGTIKRTDYYRILPEVRKRMESCFTNDEVEAFTRDAGEPHPDRVLPEHASNLVTTRMYFEALKAGYQAIGFNLDKKKLWRFTESKEEQERYHGRTPREWYCAFSDGRDNGLVNVPLDDHNALVEWLYNKGPYYTFNGSHPYEVVPSGSITNSLHVYITQEAVNYRKVENGKMWFSVAGCSEFRYMDTIKFYLAMKKAGFPVELCGRDVIEGRFFATDTIGILPEERSSFYGYSGDEFGKGVYDTINLIDIVDADKRKAVEKTASWKEPAPIRLMSFS